MISVVLGDEVKLSRDEVARRLKERGVDSRPFFVPMSALPHLASARTHDAGHDGAGEGCPVSARLSARGLNLPSGCGLTRAEVARAASALAEVLVS
jgi:perosamine synthetase